MRNGTKTYEHEEMLPGTEHKWAIMFFCHRLYPESPPGI